MIEGVCSRTIAADDRGVSSDSAYWCVGAQG